MKREGQRGEKRQIVSDTWTERVEEKDRSVEMRKERVKTARGRGK